MNRHARRVTVGAVLGLLLVVPVASARLVGATAAASAEPVLRDCGSSAYGTLGSWQPESAVVGPLGFVRSKAYARSRSTYFNTVGEGRYRGLKFLTVVRTGWKARIVVSARQRANVALVHERTSFNTPVVPSDGVHDVTLAACAPGRPLLGPRSQAWTQFNGEIVVAGKRCVVLNVYTAKQGEPLPSGPIQVRLPFGASCPR